jgi:hypothetical protein
LWMVRRLKGLELPQQPIIKGDAKSLTIADASILAKTARDELMCKLDTAHPGYGFARHKGYPCPSIAPLLGGSGLAPYIGVPLPRFGPCSACRRCRLAVRRACERGGKNSPAYSRPLAFRRSEARPSSRSASFLSCQ